jgi:hypothetical protein
MHRQSVPDGDESCAHDDDAVSPSSLTDTVVAESLFQTYHPARGTVALRSLVENNESESDRYETAVFVVVAREEGGKLERKLSFARVALNASGVPEGIQSRDGNRKDPGFRY